METSPQERLVIYGLIALIVAGSALLGWKVYRGPAWDGNLAPRRGAVAGGSSGATGPGAAQPATPAAAGEATPKPRIVVHVAGAVVNPGVYQLERGSRVDDAIRTSGGPAANGRPEVLNLAAPLIDGEKVYVPTVHEVEAAGTAVPAAGDPGGWSGQGGQGGQGGPGGKVNLNTAGREALDRLPGIGPSLAERIIRYRMGHGPFKRVDDLRNVSGIGERLLEELRGYVVVN